MSDSNRRDKRTLVYLIITLVVAIVISVTSKRDGVAPKQEDARDIEILGEELLEGIEGKAQEKETEDTLETAEEKDAQVEDDVGAKEESKEASEGAKKKAKDKDVKKENEGKQKRKVLHWSQVA